DGSIAPDPTPPGQAGAQTYTQPLRMDTNGQYRFKAQAFKDNGAGGFNSSNVIGTGTFALSDPLGAATVPTIVPPGGLYTDTVDVSFTGAQFETFWYTLDGSEPVAGPPAEPPTQFGNSSTVFPLAEPTTVRVKAYRPFFSASADATAEFRFVCATPTATPGGTYTESVTVSMASSTPAADIRYTLDGSEPTGTSPAYAGPLTLEATTTLKVKCFRGSFTPSATATELYIIEAAPQSPSIAAQPQDETADAGTNVTLSIEPANVISATVAIQWQLNGRDIAGETDPTIEIPNAQPANSGEYRALVRDEGGQVTSETATVSISPAAITGLTAAADGPTVLGAATHFAAAVATGDGVTFAWDFGDSNGGDGPNPSHTYAAVGPY
ncbi:MAG: chitobiase/beta-hexosaminidase C-terminal domain-containing protein, partial [Caldilineaceae bacterium]|nr:chitobiase/beta-hexosaminidase C-terminal domain-containing protein [Caldilineaceae bacterium]